MNKNSNLLSFIYSSSMNIGITTADVGAGKGADGCVLFGLVSTRRGPSVHFEINPRKEVKRVR